MTIKRVKFSTTNDMEFVNTLRDRVAEYFKQKDISRYGNANMVMKTVTLLAIYLIPYVLLCCLCFGFSWHSEWPV
jgi:linoleoyl-CoA desaturase